MEPIQIAGIVIPSDEGEEHTEVLRSDYIFRLLQGKTKEPSNKGI